MFDITINTAELTVEAAAEIAITALQRKLGLQLTTNSGYFYS